MSIHSVRSGSFFCAVFLFLTPCAWAIESDTTSDHEHSQRLQRLEAKFDKFWIMLESAVSRRGSHPHSRRNEEGFRALYTMSRNGSDVQFLVAAPGQISSATPEWSHDGNAIAFDSVDRLEQFTRSRLFVYAIDGPFRGMIRDLGYGNVPTWSPKDRQIAFMLNGTNPAGAQGGIWIMNADGSDRRHLCPGWYPRWSPDGQEICLHAYFEQPQKLHFYNVETGKIRNILGSPMGVKFGGATWSPDGKQVVFIGLRDGHEHLAVIEASGEVNSLRVLYREENQDRQLIGPPSWSPDGKQIVFAMLYHQQPDGVQRIWQDTFLVSLSAEVPSSPVLLESKKIGQINRGMMWSPDSQRIVFSSQR